MPRAPGRGRAARRAVLTAALVGALGAGSAACVVPGSGDGPPAAQDTARLLAVRDAGQAARLRRAGLPVSRLRRVVVGAPVRAARGQWRLTVRGDWQVAGTDRGVRSFTEHLVIAAGEDTHQEDARRGDAQGEGDTGRPGAPWRVVGATASRRPPIDLGDPDGLTPGAATQVDLQGPAIVLADARCPEEQVRRVGVAASAAVAAVRQHWGWPAGRRVLVVLPGDDEGASEVLGADPATGTAAVTDGPVPVTGPAPADSVVVVPGAFATLTAAGRRMVLTHEVQHLALRGEAHHRVPLWLSEGIADSTAYATTGLTEAQAAGELLDRVRRTGPPARLPSDDAFTTDGTAYEQAWIVVRLLRGQIGTSGLRRLHAEVAARAHQGEDLDPAVDAALREVNGQGTAQLTARWRAHLDALAGPAPPRPPGT